MSKKKNEKEATENEEIKEPPTLYPEANPPAKEPRRPTVGRCVHYFKSVAQSNGTYVLEPLAAIISGTKPPGNFQEKDMAVSVWVFPSKNGAAPEAKHGILFSETPAEGRWSWPPLV